MAHILVTIDRPYYQCLEPLELAMALAAFDHEVIICLKGHAVDLMSGQVPPLPSSGKDLNKLMKSLALYDIEIITDADTQLLNNTDESLTQLTFD